MASRPRQEPGMACQECRRKKLRCDRQRPCCGCVNASVPCLFNADRPSRGPKKGHLKELRSRIAVLERQMLRHDVGLEQPDSQSPEYLHEEFAAVTAGEIENGSFGTRELPSQSPPTAQAVQMASDEGAINNYTQAADASTFSQDSDGVRTPRSLGAESATIPTLTQADLDQLYFDRVHAFTPILQRSRYFSWVKQPSAPSGSHVCLRYAVWTMGATLSSQFQPLQNDLYLDTRRMLETLDLEDMEQAQTNGFLLQRAQAWILLAVYEFMRTTFRRAWFSAGRAFRLMQLMKLNEIDLPDDAPAAVRGMGMGMTFPGQHQVDYVDAEEKRRTFWTVFCLDRFFCTLDDHPLTVNEEMASVRLPMSEAEFQSGTPSAAPFLSDVVTTTTTTTSDDPTSMSSFTECIIFAAIWGRVLSHQQLYVAEKASVKSISEFWNRHFWLDSLLTQRIRLHQQTYPAPCTAWIEPMLLFTSMVAQAVVLSLCKVVESVSIAWQGDIVAQYRQKASAAACEMAALSKNLSQLSYFNVHPFTSIPLLHTRQYLISHKGPDIPLDGAFVQIAEVIRELKKGNLLCQAQLTLLEATTSDLLLNWDDEVFDLQMEPA